MKVPHIPEEILAARGLTKEQYEEMFHQKYEYVQDLDSGKNKGVLLIDKDSGNYKVVHEKLEPSLDEKLELISYASTVTAKLQGVTIEMQLSASEIKL